VPAAAVGRGPAPTPAQGDAGVGRVADVVVGQGDAAGVADQDADAVLVFLADVGDRVVAHGVAGGHTGGIGEVEVVELPDADTAAGSVIDAVAADGAALGA